ncbi:hypothetical protein ABN028_19410 [Actinopolymorpha sp. B17G11]|uniref:hypothetical protein n=1 Tax=Actinopolymorpha sp. B17G11 TaxID=3160861 RepID=UPI0032E4A29E
MTTFEPTAATTVELVRLAVRTLRASTEPGDKNYEKVANMTPHQAVAEAAKFIEEELDRPVTRQNPLVWEVGLSPGGTQLEIYRSQPFSDKGRGIVLPLDIPLSRIVGEVERHQAVEEFLSW